jgi:HSP20 family molecular chaperone IbpA
MQLTQYRSADAYNLDISLNGLEPGQVEIQPTRGSLVIVARRSAQTEREETFDDGRGYARSYSWSGGRSVKRLPVPPDGDLSAMQREDADGIIRVRIPRRSAPGADGAFSNPPSSPEQQ